jgi:tetratricopeptide (TPR) repeat protein
LPARGIDTTKIWTDLEGRIKEAAQQRTIEVASRLLEQRGERYPEGLISLGVAYAAIGDTDAAIHFLERASLNENVAIRTHAQLALGRVLYESKTDIGRAVDALRRAARGDPNNAVCWFYLGQAMRRLATQNLTTEASVALRRYIDAGAPLGHVEEIEEFLSSTTSSNPQMQTPDR